METEESGTSGRMEKIFLPLSMVLVQVFTMGMLLLSKIVLNKGMEPFVLLGYRNIVGVAFVAPFAFFLEREMRKKLNWLTCMWIFINAAFGIIMALGLYYYGLRDTSAAYSVNFLNLIPVVTFIIAVIIRVERLGLGSKEGKVKIIGAILCVVGTMIVSLYKGYYLHIWPTRLLKNHGEINLIIHHNWFRGTLLLVISCLGYAFWFITQVKLFKIFPSKYWTTMLTCVAGSFQAIIIGIVIDRDKATWALGWNMQLFTIIYSGVLNTGATFCLVSWAIARRGPTYPSMFNSLSVIFTTIIDSILMGPDITIGGVLGTCLIIGGLYAFLWGKGKELQKDNNRKARESDAVSVQTQSSSDDVR